MIKPIIDDNRFSAGHIYSAGR